MAPGGFFVCQTSGPSQRTRPSQAIRPSQTTRRTRVFSRLARRLRRLWRLSGSAWPERELVLRLSRARFCSVQSQTDASTLDHQRPGLRTWKTGELGLTTSLSLSRSRSASSLAAWQWGCRTAICVSHPDVKKSEKSFASPARTILSCRATPFRRDPVRDSADWSSFRATSIRRLADALHARRQAASAPIGDTHLLSSLGVDPDRMGRALA